MTAGTISIIVGTAILVLLKVLFKSKAEANQDKEGLGVDHNGLLKEEPEFDRTWPFLPNNIFHRSNDD